ncbi:dynein heavy chain 2, axonemal, partial [Nephila pilipes]
MVLYVPDEIIDKDLITIIEQKDLLNQVERTVLKWIWLIMGIIMKRDANIEDSGPLEETEFWEMKCETLENVLVQLQRDDVKMCIEILKTAQLVSYIKFMEVSNQLQNEFYVAQSNIKFLSILKTSCRDIESSLLSEIPEHLSRLLDLVRIIWNNSPYFKKQNEISNLLCKVNNFVIKVVSHYIPMEEIFQNRTSEQKQNLLDVISCCNKWIKIFDS